MTGASQTHIGYVREENQDKVEIRQFGKNLLVVLCDGMGGERSGGKASAMAIDVIFEHFTEGYTKDMDAYGVRALLLASVSAANSVIYTSARMDYQNFGMGTTCVVAFVTDTYIGIVNVGDSRAYLLTNYCMEQLTVDHTVVHMLLEQGEITEDQLETNPQRHMLIKAVGVERTVVPDYFRIDLEENQSYRLMLCSDGLCGFCSDEEIKSVLCGTSDAESCVQELIEMALATGGRDNISVAVVTMRENEGGAE